MQLFVDSDAEYLNAPKSRSRAGGYHFLGTNDEKLFNGHIFILPKTIAISRGYFPGRLYK